MKTNNNTASTTETTTLGWNKMPAYGEVMTELAGACHTDVLSSLKLGQKSLLTSFWSTLSHLK